MQNLINYNRAAEFLDIKLGTLYSLVCRKQIPHLRFSKRLVRFDPEELKKWVDARAVCDCRMQREDG